MLRILNTLRLIKNGHFKIKKKNENPMVLIIASGFLGLSIGRVLLGKISQDTAYTIMITLLIFLGLLFSVGTHNFIKHYFVKKAYGR